MMSCQIAPMNRGHFSQTLPNFPMSFTLKKLYENIISFI